MKLDAYLNRPGSISAAELGRRIGLVNADHLRAWQHGYAGRKPSPKFCVAIERETEGEVTRQDLRPDDYWLHWPDLPAPSGSGAPVGEHAAAAQELRSQAEADLVLTAARVVLRDGPSNSRER